MAHGYKSQHNSPADPAIKKAMMQGHSLSATANYSGSKPLGNEFNSDGGMKMVGDHKSKAMSYGKSTMRAHSTPMMKSPGKSWRSSGSRSRANRSESRGSTGGRQG